MNAPSISPKAGPHCPVHLATPMTLVKSRAPAWLVMPEGATDMEFDDGVPSGTHKKRFERKFWKCPVAGCFRVQGYEMTDGELSVLRRECPSCGAPTDASAMQRAVSQFTCKNCLREKRELRRLEADARRSRRARLAAAAEMQEQEGTEEAGQFAETLLDAWRELPAKRREARA